MESNRNITNDIVTEYINRFYEPVSDELGMLRLESEAEKIPIILKETESFLSRVYHGSVSLMVNSLTQKQALPQEEIDELYELLKKIEEGDHHDRE